MGCYKLHTEDYFLPLRVVRGGVYKKIRVNARDIGAAEKMENGEKSYLLKDHLGNVRVVITEEQQQDIYPAATLEDVTYNGGTAISQEQKYYDINPAKVVPRATATGIPNYTNQNTPAPPNNNQYSNTAANSAKLYKLNSTSGLPADKMGLGVTLKVMAGDRIDVAGKSYYFQQTAGQSGNNLLQLADVLTGFLGGASGAGVTNVHGAVTPGQINPGTTNPTINNLLNTQATQSNATPNNPRAFINVIFFDEQFKVIDFKVSKVGDPNVLKENHLQDLQNLVATKSGFVYIYCSNESPVNVFFDNVQVVHTRGALLEESHYYPFGERMFNICSAAAGAMDNRKKYNGIEFNNDLDINTYEAPLRDLDPQIGRWWQIDPLTEKMEMWSPYTSNYDNPIRFSDPNGDEPCCGVNPIIDFIEMKMMEWRLDMSMGAQNITNGAAKMVTSEQGTNQELPVVAQKMQALEGKVQVTAGIAGMVKPGLEAANMIGGSLVGVELAEAPMVTGGSVWFGADVFANPGSVNLAARATQIQGVQGKFAQSVSTTAVGTGVTQNGENVTMVSSSNARLSPNQRAALNPNEIAIKNKDLGVKSNVRIHAEQKITQYAAQNNIKVGNIAASRGICSTCAAAINNSGGTPVFRTGTPKKSVPLK
jgi:RHS repeat-associated protein